MTAIGETVRDVTVFDGTVRVVTAFGGAARKSRVRGLRAGIRERRSLSLLLLIPTRSPSSPMLAFPCSIAAPTLVPRHDREASHSLRRCHVSSRSRSLSMHPVHVVDFCRHVFRRDSREAVESLRNALGSPAVAFCSARGSGERLQSSPAVPMSRSEAPASPKKCVVDEGVEFASASDQGRVRDGTRRRDWISG
jgi:hypothetical protein